MEYYWLYIPGIVILMMPIVYSVYKNHAEAKKQRLRAYYTVANRCHHVLFMRTADPVISYMEEYEATYAMTEPLLCESERKHFHDDMIELKDHLSDIELEHWRRRAAPHLQSFFDCYYSLRNEAALNTPQQNQQLKRKCIREWQAYFGIQLDRYQTRITPKSFFKEWMGEDYEDCMNEHYRLERRLDQFIRDAKK